MTKITKIRVPIQSTQALMGASGGWLRVVGGLQHHEIVTLLRKRWSSFQVPYLQSLSDAILSRELVCLSIDSHGNQWLSFEDATSSLHVAPQAKLPTELRSQFPFHQIAGLADFLENFGGLADGSLPPCPWFTPVEDCRVVASDCDSYDWGMIGDWAGSLTLYNTCGGNFIVVSPNNVCALWDHDIGWECRNDNPFENLGWTMSDLVEEFIKYLSLAESEAPNSPFYY